LQSGRHPIHRYQQDVFELLPFSFVDEISPQALQSSQLDVR
jgi:hypothetical protein